MEKTLGRTANGRAGWRQWCQRATGREGYSGFAQPFTIAKLIRCVCQSRSGLETGVDLLPPDSASPTSRFMNASACRSLWLPTRNGALMTGCKTAGVVVLAFLTTALLPGCSREQRQASQVEPEPAEPMAPPAPRIVWVFMYFFFDCLIKQRSGDRGSTPLTFVKK